MHTKYYIQESSNLFENSHGQKELDTTIIELHFKQNLDSMWLFSVDQL